MLLVELVHLLVGPGLERLRRHGAGAAEEQQRELGGGEERQ
jgi:hypothetical protein